MSFTKIPILFHSWRSCWSRRSCSSRAWVWSISLRWDSIIPLNSCILLLSESAWNSYLWISALQLARICSFCRSRRILICSFSESQLGFFSAAWTKRTKFMHRSPRSYMTDRKRLRRQQTFFKRVISLSAVRWFFSLLKEQWWRERSADGLVTELRVMQIRGHRVAWSLLEEDFSGLGVEEIVEEVGLITCERGVIGQRARLLTGRSAQGILLRGHPHGRGRGKSQGSGRRSGR